MTLEILLKLFHLLEADDKPSYYVSNEEGSGTDDVSQFSGRDANGTNESLDDRSGLTGISDIPDRLTSDTGSSLAIASEAKESLETAECPLADQSRALLLCACRRKKMGLVKCFPFLQGQVEGVTEVPGLSTRNSRASMVLQTPENRLGPCLCEPDKTASHSCKPSQSCPFPLTTSKSKEVQETSIREGHREDTSIRVAERTRRSPIYPVPPTTAGGDRNPNLPHHLNRRLSKSSNPAQKDKFSTDNASTTSFSS